MLIWAFRVNLLILIVFLLTSCGGWQEHNSTAGGYSVLMPKSPEEETTVLNHPQIGPIELRSSVAESNDGAFLVAYADLPQQFVETNDPIILLDSSRDQVVAGVQGSLLSEEIISIDGHPGRGVNFEIPVPNGRGNARLRIYLVGSRLYEVLWVGTPERQFHGDVEKFLDSFELLNGQTVVQIFATSPAQPTKAIITNGLRTIDPAGNFSLILPEGWEADLDFARNMIRELYGTGFEVKFFAGKPIVGGFEPSLMVLNVAIPSNTDRKLLIEEMIAADTEGVDRIGTESVERETINIAGEVAEQVTYIDRPDIDFPQGFETFGFLLVRDNGSWSLICSGGRELDAELAQCKEALGTFRFER